MRSCKTISRALRLNQGESTSSGGKPVGDQMLPYVSAEWVETEYSKQIICSVYERVHHMHTISYMYVYIHTYICAIQKCMLVTEKKQITNNGHPITTAGHNYMLSYMLGFQPNLCVPTGPRPRDEHPTWWHQHVIILSVSSNHETSPSTWYTNTNVVKNGN